MPHKMSRGSSDIPELRLEVLQKFVTRFTAPPNLILMNIFPSSTSPSSTIRWESQRGGRGLTPFVPPGAPAHVTAPHGVAQHLAESAYWKEKMPFDEEFLNNLRKEGTEAQYLSAQQRLARELSYLRNRSNRRIEWMFAKMLFTGSFNYQVKGGYSATVDYNIPDDHNVTLGSAYNWDDGASKDIIGDIRDGKRKIKEDCGGTVTLAICNSKVLSYLGDDSTIRALLQKNHFGTGDLFSGAKNRLAMINPKVVASILDIDNLVVYDEMYEVRAWLTAAVTGASTTWISVDDTGDFEAKGKLRFWDQSAGTYEDRIIISVDTVGGRIQVAYPPAASYKAAEDYVTMAKYFIPDDKFVMIAPSVEGNPIAEYKQAPFGLGRHFGQYTDKKDKWDPEVTWIRVQDKGIPVLYQRDALYILDVKITTEDSATTTTSSTTTTTTTGGG